MFWCLSLSDGFLLLVWFSGINLQHCIAKSPQIRTFLLFFVFNSRHREIWILLLIIETSPLLLWFFLSIVQVKNKACRCLIVTLFKTREEYNLGSYCWSRKHKGRVLSDVMDTFWLVFFRTGKLYLSPNHYLMLQRRRIPHK